MRGTPCPNGCQVLLTRFIPSYAGNAANTRPTVSPTPVHPRMRGERTVAVMIRSAPYGSSPHARGTLLYLGNSLAEYRGILACTGNASPTAGTSWTSSVHPRIRGERGYWRISAEKSGGSSPHMRGTPGHAPVHGLHLRFIPACAGNAWPATCSWITWPVHPRMRGERFTPSVTSARYVGSSPHARGTLHSIATRHPPTRFIPACAGNAASALPPHRAAPVHPRMRGERTARIFPRAYARGSSPHARGTPDVRHLGTVKTRFIPACAGNARHINLEPLAGTVHPRMRGERAPATLPIEASFGSSPHARGTQPLEPCHSLCRRFIPACAGNAASSCSPSQ